MSVLFLLIFPHLQFEVDDDPRYTFSNIEPETGEQWFVIIKERDVAQR